MTFSIKTLVSTCMAFSLLLIPALAVSKPTDTPREMRGVWLTNVDSHVLDSHQATAEAMKFLADHHFNVVFPVVWNGGYTLYPSQVMEDEFGVRISPLRKGRDPLADVITEAHRYGLEVIPWFEFGFASSYNQDGGYLLEQRPEWAAIDQYGQLVKKNNFEWMNAFDPEVQSFLTSLIMEVVENYDIDGIQGDDRLPALPTLGGYDAATKARYREEFGVDPPADYKDPQWVQWRADILTEFLVDLRKKVKKVDQNLIVSMAPSYYDWSLTEYLQDSKNWTNKGLVDAIHPQAYRKDIKSYQAIIDDLIQNQFSQDQLSRLYPGMLMKVGGYRIDEKYLLKAISYNRKNGINGEAFFFYEGLREADQILAMALLNGPYKEKATIPWREGKNWRPEAVYARWDSSGIDEWEKVSTIFLSQSGGEKGRLKYTLNAPVEGVYFLYANVPSFPSMGKAAYTIALGGESADSVLVDQEVQQGWVPLGSYHLKSDRNDQFIYLHNLEEDKERSVYASSVMMMLNRKKSPDVIWP